MKYAYVGILYGSNEYYLGALVMGYTLAKTNTKYDKILLVTSDVNNEIREILKTYFIIKEVEYLYINNNNFYDKNTRFKEVFTKLQALNLDYDKIIMLDLDMFILKNLDHLFELSAPAAMVRETNLEYGEKIPPELIKIRNGKISGGINAGLMLLEPSKKEFNEIMNEVKKQLPYKLKYPEQDFLSLRYKNKWTNIDSRYNCQFTIKEVMEYKNYSIHDIYILHYSWILNPWELILENKDKVLYILNKSKRDITYYTLWGNHYRILEKIHNNINLLDLFKYSGNFNERINKLYDELKNN